MITSRLLRSAELVTTAVLFLVTLGAFCACQRAKGPVASVTVQASVDPLKVALDKVEQDRGEPVGRSADVEVPPELRHYSDRRRFLAVQTAEDYQQHLQLPHDYSELADMVRDGELVELPALGEDYVLVGVGEAATTDPFTHYDNKSGLDITLCATHDEYLAERRKLSESIDAASLVLEQLQRKARLLSKRDRAGRLGLAREIRAIRTRIARMSQTEQLMIKLYANPETANAMRAERRAISSLARDFSGQSYDLADPDSRRMLKMRLLSFARPEAQAMLFEIARGYREKFERPLPVTSLIRTRQYQKRLSEWNRNAARNAMPPHVAGLAFDILYRFMSASEQEYLMSVIASLKSAGRIEALRESRDHIHVFTFANAAPPAESLVARAISETPAKYSTRTSSRSSRGKRKPVTSAP